MTEKERELLVEIMVNVDDVKRELTKGQKEKVKKCFLKIYGNFHNLMDGVR